MGNKIQQRIQLLNQAIKTLKEEREYWLKRCYNKCGDCKFFIKTTHKRNISYKCSVNARKYLTTRLKACDKFENNESILLEKIEDINT